MKKCGRIVLCAAMFAILGGVTTSFAGEWKTEEGLWKYDKDGTYAVSEWIEDDGKWYYMDGNGYMAANTWVGNYYLGAGGAMLVDTVTPDGYQVGADGAWVEASVMQDTEYLEKYAEVLRGLPVPNYGSHRFVLAYIDGDDIPELIVETGEYKSFPSMYTYDQGNVKLLGEFKYGTILNYVEKGNLIYSDCFETGMNQYDEFYRIENGEQITIAEFYSKNDVPDLSYRFYEINHQEVPESTYRSQLNTMKNGHSFKTVEYNSYHEINEESIQKMLADTNSAM